MSFLANLGKGFVRSAVNQVGRDGGRVISNKVFGDAHATPVRHVGSAGTHVGGGSPSTEGMTDLQLRAWAMEHGYKLTGRRSSSLSSTLAMAIHALFPLYYGGLMFGLAAFRRLYLLFWGKAWFAKKISHYERVADRRYKSGEKMVANGTNLEVVEVEPQAVERLVHIPRLLLYTALAVANIWFSVVFWQSLNDEDQQPNEEPIEQVATE